MASYAMDESFTFETDKTAVYYENSNFTNMPLFTEQELYCFLPAQQSILAEEESRGYWMPDYACSKTNMGVYPQFSGYYDQSMDNTIVPVQDCFSMGIQDGYIGAEEGAYSCQASPFLRPQYPRPPFTNHTQSPITPLGSPMFADNNFYQNVAPSFLIPTTVGYENNQDRGCECNYQSPIPSVDFDAMALFPTSQTPSPVSDSSYLSSPELGSPGSDDDDDDDDEEYENDLSLLPQQGNKELRGMGLYDDVPDLLYTNCSTPSGCSPIMPHNTLGKGLVLERSFGLPEEMMMKDESSGKIVKGKFDTEDEEEEPMLYGEEESLDWDRGYQVTYQPQYDGISFYNAQINRQW